MANKGTIRVIASAVMILGCLKVESDSSQALAVEKQDGTVLLRADESNGTVRIDGTIENQHDATNKYQIIADGGGFRVAPVNNNETGSIRIVPKGNPTGPSLGGYTRAQARVYYTESTAGDIESISLESHYNKNASSPDVFTDPRYYIKTRTAGTGQHHPLTFQIGGNDILTLTTDNKAGVGVTNPNGKFQVQGAVSRGTGSLRSSGTTVTGNGTSFTTQLKVGDTMMISENNNHQTRRVTAIASATSLTTDMAFSPSLPSDTSFEYSRPLLFVVEGSRGHPTGSIGIGMTAPAFPLDVAGPVHATGFPISSDARFMKNVRPLSHVLEKLNQIHGVSFEWNEAYERLGRSTGHREIGLVADEVEAVFPELVTRWGEESYRAIDYGRLTGVLIEAIKEQQKQIEMLKNELVVVKRNEWRRPDSRSRISDRGLERPPKTR